MFVVKYADALCMANVYLYNRWWALVGRKASVTLNLMPFMSVSLAFDKKMKKNRFFVALRPFVRCTNSFAALIMKHIRQRRLPRTQKCAQIALPNSPSAVQRQNWKQSKIIDSFHWRNKMLHISMYWLELTCLDAYAAFWGLSFSLTELKLKLNNNFISDFPWIASRFNDTNKLIWWKKYILYRHKFMRAHFRFSSFERPRKSRPSLSPIDMRINGQANCS